MSAGNKVLAALAGLAIILVLLVGGFFVIFYLTTTYCVMTKYSPDGNHGAKLYRVQGIDVDFSVIVDGNRVYDSPDFAPVHADFREQIAWDKSGQILVLEVGGKRLFGYQAVEKKPLTDAELLSVEFTTFEELGYEGTLPSGKVE
jgi:hypothetical protein